MESRHNVAAAWNASSIDALIDMLKKVEKKIYQTGSDLAVLVEEGATCQLHYIDVNSGTSWRMSEYIDCNGSFEDTFDVSELLLELGDLRDAINAPRPPSPNGHNPITRSNHVSVLDLTPGTRFVISPEEIFSMLPPHFYDRLDAFILDSHYPGREYSPFRHGFLAAGDAISPRVHGPVQQAIIPVSGLCLWVYWPPSAENVVQCVYRMEDVGWMSLEWAVDKLQGPSFSILAPGTSLVLPPRSISSIVSLTPSSYASIEFHDLSSVHQSLEVERLFDACWAAYLGDCDDADLRRHQKSVEGLGRRTLPDGERSLTPSTQVEKQPPLAASALVSDVEVLYDYLVDQWLCAPMSKLHAAVVGERGLLAVRLRRWLAQHECY